MTPIAFIILSLATWRIVNLLVDDSEDGPYHLLHTVRFWLGVRYDDKHRPYGKHELGKIFTCQWCASIWIGTVVAITHYFWPGATVWVYLPFALSATSLLINKQVKR